MPLTATVSLPPLDRPEIVYQVAVPRGGRGAWRWEETWGAVTSRPLRRPRLRPWAPVGTLAERVARKDTALARELRDLIGHLGPLRHRGRRRRPGAVAHQGVRAVFTVGEQDGRAVTWGVMDARAAIRMSALLGATFGTLRVCTGSRCDRVFLAETRTQQRCPVCDRSRTLSLRQHDIYRRVLARLRMGKHADRISEARADLSERPFSSWEQKWDRPGPRGRPRKGTIRPAHGRRSMRRGRAG